MEIKFDNLIGYIDAFFLRYYTIYLKIMGGSLRDDNDEDIRSKLPGMGGDCLIAARVICKELIATGNVSRSGELSDRLYGIRFMLSIRLPSEGIAELKIKVVDNPPNSKIKKDIKKVVTQLKKEGYDVET